MTCNELLDRAPDIVDGDVPAPLRPAIDAHLASCAACRATIADLQRIAQTAATLGHVAPPTTTWHRVAAGLQADPDFRRIAKPARQAHAQATPGWAWLSAAAILVVFVGGGLWMLRQSVPAGSEVAGTAAGNADAASPVESVEAELQLAADHYEKAISALERAADQADSPLDPEVMATLRKNLEVIDLAITESRGALRNAPDNRVAQESLIDAFRRKLALLQDTVALMNEMRKGNQAGAARIVEGMNKS
jgi:tetratricopeptide (TPR) repeat protein